MNNEYIIINKTAIQKRIEELEKWSKEFYYGEGIDEYDFAKEELEQVLSQSTPLIPEIEKAHNTGRNYGCYLQGGSYDPNDNIDSEDFISNLKLDI
jgi:hypothetical protein